MFFCAGAPKRKKPKAEYREDNATEEGEEEDEVEDEEPRAKRERLEDKWGEDHIAFESAFTQFHVTAPSCWKEYGGSGKRMQRWTPPIPIGSGVEDFSVGYTERRCRGQGCPASMRLLEPIPAEKEKLTQISIAPYAVFRSKKLHLAELRIGLHAQIHAATRPSAKSRKMKMRCSRALTKRQTRNVCANER